MDIKPGELLRLKGKGVETGKVTEFEIEEEFEEIEEEEEGIIEPEF